MDERAFDTLADRTLQHLFARIDAELADVADVDLRGGILTVALDDGRQYVINKHGPNRADLDVLAGIRRFALRP